MKKAILLIIFILLLVSFVQAGVVGGLNTVNENKSWSYDVFKPNVDLQTPVNLTTFTTASQDFIYNVSDSLTAITNCSILINGSIISTATNISQFNNQTFKLSLGESNKLQNFSIECYDGVRAGDLRYNTFYVKIPPTLSNISSGTPTLDSAVISWDTNENTNGTLFYGTTTETTSISRNLSVDTSHSISLSELDCGSTYYYNVSSIDTIGEIRTSSQYSFSTINCVVEGGGTGLNVPSTTDQGVGLLSIFGVEDGVSFDLFGWLGNYFFGTKQTITIHDEVVDEETGEVTIISREESSRSPSILSQKLGVDYKTMLFVIGLLILILILYQTGIIQALIGKTIGLGLTGLAVILILIWFIIKYIWR